VRSFVNMLDHYYKIDDRTIAIYTKSPFSFFPYMVPTMLMVSPAQWEKAGRSHSPSTILTCAGDHPPLHLQQICSKISPSDCGTPPARFPPAPRPSLPQIDGSLANPSAASLHPNDAI
jgi:hypothetical protein